MVHLVNFTTKNAAKIPKKVKSSARDFLHHILYLTDSLLKVGLEHCTVSKMILNIVLFSCTFQMIHIERGQDVVQKISLGYDEVQKTTSCALVIIIYLYLLSFISYN